MDAVSGSGADVKEALTIARDRVDAETLKEGERVAVVPKVWFESFVRGTEPVSYTHLTLPTILLV